MGKIKANQLTEISLTMNINKNSLYIVYLLITVTAISGSAILNGCKTKVDNTYKLTGDVITDGQNLVQLKCTSCHKLVPADALLCDRKQQFAIARNAGRRIVHLRIIKPD